MTSPVTSYADQIISMHRNRSSAGFSLDIPLIMLLASILKIFYRLGTPYATSLVLQSLLMIGIQTILLHIALLHRPPSTHHIPFSTTDGSSTRRPYNFWQWTTHRPYWSFLAYFTTTLFILQLIIGSVPGYSSLLGTVALTIEATLPIPQLLANWKRGGCKGFRPSVLVNWLIGDAFKMWFFFASASGEVPWAFKLCGLFQAFCDAGLGVQWYAWGDGPLEYGKGVGIPMENGKGKGKDSMELRE